MFWTACGISWVGDASCCLPGTGHSHEPEPSCSPLHPPPPSTQPAVHMRPSFPGTQALQAPPFFGPRRNGTGGKRPLLPFFQGRVVGKTRMTGIQRRLLPREPFQQEAQSPSSPVHSTTPPTPASIYPLGTPGSPPIPAPKDWRKSLPLGHEGGSCELGRDAVYRGRISRAPFYQAPCSSPSFPQAPEFPPPREGNQGQRHRGQGRCRASFSGPPTGAGAPAGASSFSPAPRSLEWLTMPPP